jgi:hypothetical protein
VVQIMRAKTLGLLTTQCEDTDRGLMHITFIRLMVGGNGKYEEIFNRNVPSSGYTRNF